MSNICEYCGHTRTAHAYDKDSGWTCQLCDCVKPVLSVTMSVREAARRYAAERNTGRQVNDLAVKDVALLREVFRSAHECKGLSLTPFEKTNRQMDVEELAEKLGVEL